MPRRTMLLLSIVAWFTLALGSGPACLGKGDDETPPEELPPTEEQSTDPSTLPEDPPPEVLPEPEPLCAEHDPAGDLLDDRDLVLFLRFGTTTCDDSDLGHHGILNGTLTPTKDRFLSENAASSFDGTSSSVRVPLSTTLGESFTLAAWVKPSTKKTQIVARTGASVTTAISLQLTAKEQVSATLHTAGTTITLTGGTYATEVWSSIVLTYNGTQAALYLNGTQVATSELRGVLAGPPSELLIGTRLGIAADTFAGPIDDLRLYTRGLDAAGVRALHEETGADNIPPETTLVEKPATLGNQKDIVFTFTSNEANVGFQCDLDTSGWAPCLSGLTYPGLADGQHTFLVRAVDVAGNQDATPASHTFTVETLPPETEWTGTLPGLSASATQSFTFRCNETGCTFACSLDGTDFATCTSGQTSRNLADGSHQLLVRATDAAGNLDQSPAEHTWTVDTTPPTSPYARIVVASTRRHDVEVELASDDATSGVAGHCLKETPEQPTVNHACWTPIEETLVFEGTAVFQLSEGTGRKVVYAWFRDKAGNLSAYVTASVKVLP